ncbi:MAG TPA: DUF1549 domain-containing protein [Planctomycetaceae bacterium]|nr:DUF1549 domain-containing protein [Planctomycetaceae bacterium]
MRMLRPALAVAAAVLVSFNLARAADLLPSDRPIAEVVDHYIDLGLGKLPIKPASRADDATLFRRLALDLDGRIPTAAESRAYCASTAHDKRTKLVDRLMASPAFVRHQATELDAMLMAGAKGSLREYLLQAAGENRPWDRIFRELMLPDQTDKAQKAAALYLRQGLKDMDRLTADVSSTFFGVNISCAQCHDHPLVRDWKQDHFFGMKSFLNRTFVNGNGNESFLGERGYGQIRFKTTDDVEKQAKLMFLTGRRVEESDANEPSKDEQKKEKEGLDRSKKDKVPPPPPKFSARAKLVELALLPGEREFFSKAIVNRIWYRLFGHGLVMPLDQMHSANPPSHPELLAWLARDVANHGYDLRRLVRGLVLSEAYSRSSRWEGADQPRPSLFAVALVRPLTAMQLATSLRLATADPASLPHDFVSEQFEKQIQALEESGRPLASSFATSGGDSQISVTEALLFSNGKRISGELLGEGADRLVSRLEKTARPADVVDLAVQNVLSRPPDDEELRTLGAFLENRTDRPDDARRQLVWVLLTDAEFRFNH